MHTFLLCCDEFWDSIPWSSERQDCTLLHWISSCYCAWIQASTSWRFEEVYCMKPVNTAICGRDTAGHAQVDRRVCDCAHKGMSHVPWDTHIFHANIHRPQKHASARAGMHSRRMLPQSVSFGWFMIESFHCQTGKCNPHPHSSCASQTRHASPELIISRTGGEKDSGQLDLAPPATLFTQHTSVANETVFTR